MAKKKKKDRSQKKRQHAASMPRNVDHRLAKVDDLLERRQWAEALPLLKELERRYPNREDVLLPLAQVTYELHDHGEHQEVCERLHRLVPGSAEITLMLGGAYLLNGRPMLALHTFRRALQRWPDHPKAEEVRHTATALEADLDRMMAAEGLTGDDARQVAALHEETLSLLEQHKYARARQTAEQLLKLRPQFAPALNNIGESWFREGQVDQAVEAAQRVLGSEPDNFHALSNLTRYLFLSGHPEESRQAAERLRAVQSPKEDVWVKKAEAFAVLGDDQAVLDALHGYEESGKPMFPMNVGLLYHLAAAATCRQGREDEARRLWGRALREAPGLNLAQGNMEDLDGPVAERHAPWPLGLAYWLPPPIIEALTAHLERAQRHGKEDAVTQEVRRYLELHPAVAALVPPLLDRGDPAGREFAVRLALMAETPALLAALRDFALGQRGPDRLRLEAANAACRVGLFPTGPARLWIRGEWQEMLLLGWELHGEPIYRHPPNVEKLAREAMDALYGDDPEAAEKLLRQALEHAPDAPDLLNNLASAYKAQGRVDEGNALIHQIHERHPDYLFAQANIAFEHIENGELDKAKELLQPLLQRPRLHFSELATLASAQIVLCLAQGNREAARSWFDLWESADPKHPGLSQFRERLRPSPPGWMGRLLGRR
jgi:tetratricopeptide (TPR) repeat protein